MPTIKKINLNGTQYDIGGGLTEDVKQASLQIAEKVAYIDEHGQDYYDDLYNAFYENTWEISANLSNASSSNPVESIEKGESYTTIISANTGYTLDGATVSVTMGGANVTSAVYSNGVVNIPAVTGDVVITVVAVALTVVSISAVYTQSGDVHPSDSLDSLKDDLVVTATFSDSSTVVVPSADYTLTGTLTVGTSIVTVEYSGETTTFNVIVTQKMTLKLSEGDFNIQTGGLVWQQSSQYEITRLMTSSQIASRRGIYTDSGVHPYYTQETAGGALSVTDPPQYPIPIPADAIGVRYSITPSTQFMGASLYTYDASTQKYTRVTDVGWKQGTYTHSFAAGSVQYFACVTKYDSAGGTYPVEPSEIIIEFLTS